MNRNDLLSARESLQENIRTFLDGLPSQAITDACQLVVNEFETLLDKQKKAVRQSIAVTQIGNSGYRIDKLTNIFDLQCGVRLQMSELETLKENGVSVTFSKNK